MIRRFLIQGDGLMSGSGVDRAAVSNRSLAMSGKWVFRFGLGVVGTVVLASTYVIAQQKPAGPPPPMTFFITSVGLGDGGNLGGLTGADAHCQKLATAVGAGSRTWRAYLSTSAQGNQPAVNARDR